jgi:hypothetical protein
MSERPRVVTVIGWFWRVGGIIGLVLALPLALWGQGLFGEYWADFLLRISPTALFLWMLLSSLLCVLFGNGILKGRGWARTLALGYGVLATLIAGLLYRGNPLYWLNLIVDVVFTAIMWFFLYRPEATSFFKVEGSVVG